MLCNKGVTWQELFEGFDEMYVITFSTGIEFTLQLLDKFKYSEIIYGCEAVLPPGISAVMAVETEMISKIVKNILIYSGAADSRYYLKTIADELPRTLDAKLNVETLTMNLKEARILFACKFRRGIFGKIK